MGKTGSRRPTLLPLSRRTSSIPVDLSQSDYGLLQHRLRSTKEICRLAQCRLHTWKSAYRQGLSKLPSPSLTRRTSEHDFGLPSQTGKYSRLQLLVEHCALRNVDTANLEFHSPRDTQARRELSGTCPNVRVHGSSFRFAHRDVPLCAPSVRPHTTCFRHRIKRDEARRNSKGAKRPMREEGDQQLIYPKSG